MKSKNLILILFILALSFWKITASTPLNKETKTLLFAIQYTFDFNFDPVERNYISIHCLFRSIYSTLFSLDSNLRTHPFLLESYRRNGKAVTFNIIDNARFSDGTPITPADVVGSIEAGMRHSASPNPLYKVIEGGESFFQGNTQHCTGIKEQGPKSVEIRFVDENVDFAYYFTASIMSVLPKHRNRNRKPENMGFSGSFRVANFQQKENIAVVTLEPNPYYLGKKSNIDTLIIYFYLEHKDFDQAIQKGEPDLFLYNRHVKLPLSSYKYNYFKTPTFGAFYFKLNACSGPFQDKRLRTFLKNFILSWDFIGDEDWDLVAPAKMVLPYSLTGYFVFNPMTPGDFKKLAPQKNTKIICVNPEAELRRILLPKLKEELIKYNLELVLQWEELTNLYEREKNRNFDLISYYYMVDVPLSIYFYDSLFTPGHELNLSGYEVPEALKLLDAYQKETNELKKLKILSRLESIAQEEAFLIPVLNPLSFLGYKRHVKNVKIDKFLYINFEDIDVEKGN